MASRLVYLKGTREDSVSSTRLVAEPASADRFRKEETMSEERFEQDEREDEEVEAHGHETLARGHETLRNTTKSDELGDENDDVEAHRRRTT
jgi:hypothetical protein